MFTKKMCMLLPAIHENSSHLSIAAVLFSKVTAASSLLIGKGSFCLSLVVVCVVHVSQSPLLFLAFVVVLICDLFSYSSFLRAPCACQTDNGQTPRVFSVQRIYFSTVISTVRESFVCLTEEGQSPRVFSSNSGEHLQ